MNPSRQATPPAETPAPEGPEPAATTITITPATSKASASRKSGRPPARRGRLGRNQYTRDRDRERDREPPDDANVADINTPRGSQQAGTGADADSPIAVAPTGPNGTQGRDSQREQHQQGQQTQSNHQNHHTDTRTPIGGGGSGVGGGGESGRPSKPRYMNPHRVTMNEMRRRVAGILEFISRMQVDMAVNGERTTPPEPVAPAPADASAGTGDAGAGAVSAPAGSTEERAERPFNELSSVEMMDALTRNLLKWQQEYGKYGEKT